MHRIGVWTSKRGQCVPEPVVRDPPPLGGRDHARSALQAHRDTIDRLLQLCHRYRRPVAAGGQQGGLVDYVGQLGAGEPRGARCHEIEVHARVKRPLASLDGHNGRAAAAVRSINRNLPVKPAPAQQRRVKHLRPVGRGHDDHARGRVRAIHLGQ